MCVTILVDWLVSSKINQSENGLKRKRLLKISIVTNLTILGFFKYFNFFADSASDLLRTFGYEPGYITLNIVLPVGISFYTFQSMSYVIDVYNKKMRPVKNILDYAAYVSFFPQLVAGPIERGTNLVPQVLSARKMTIPLFHEGCFLVLWGLYKKIFIADNLAKFVDPVFANQSGFSGGEVFIALLAFTFQIYCDFSAYSDIARGTAKMMGFNLMLNFRLPYFSSNPSEFWRRWHISLSTWLRDYLYIPLGGNQQGSLLTYRNLFLTMLLGGLWHGASWTFVLWGSYQGVLLILHRLYRNRFPNVWITKENEISFSKALKALMFFPFVCFGWLVFRAETSGQIIEMTRALAFDLELSQHLNDLFKIVFYISPLMTIQLAQYYRSNMLTMITWPMWLKVTFYLAILYSILIFGDFSSNEFIYFQF